MHKQVSGGTVNFCPNSPESPFLEFQARKPPSPMKNFRFEMTKVYSGIPPQMKNFRFEMTKVYSEIPPPQWKTSDLRWPKFTPKYPPPMKNFRFEMTKVYSKIPSHPPNEKLQIWDDQSLLRNTPPPMKNFRFEMTKVYSEIPPSVGSESGRSYVETNLYPRGYHSFTSVWWETVGNFLQK